MIIKMMHGYGAEIDHASRVAKRPIKIRNVKRRPVANRQTAQASLGSVK
jgi:hypothetical protein